MPYANLSNAAVTIPSLSGIVIIENLETIPGGRTLNVTGFADAEIKAGHVIIKETATGDYKPLPVTGILPSLHTYAGVLVAGVTALKPFASILVRGSVNKVAAPYAIAAAVETALPLIRFTND